MPLGKKCWLFAVTLFVALRSLSCREMVPEGLHGVKLVRVVGAYMFVFMDLLWYFE